MDFSKGSYLKFIFQLSLTGKHIYLYFQNMFCNKGRQTENNNLIWCPDLSLVCIVRIWQKSEVF